MLNGSLILMDESEVLFSYSHLTIQLRRQGKSLSLLFELYNKTKDLGENRKMWNWIGIRKQQININY